MQEVYIVMLYHKTEDDELEYFLDSVFSTREKAEKHCMEFNKKYERSNLWLDFISKTVDEKESEVID